MHRFEVYKDKKGEFRFRFRASNGEAMFASEGYASKASATKAIASIKEHVGAADITDMTKAEKPAEAKAEKKPKAEKAKTEKAKAEKPKSDKAKAEKGKKAKVAA